MKTEFSTPFESWLVVALIAILSAPILGVVVSGCIKKEEVMLSGLAEPAVSFGESSRPRTVEDRFPAPKRLSVKEKAPSAEAKEKESAGEDRTVSKSMDESAEGGGKETGSDSGSEGEKVKNPEASPALQSARRLLKIFEATEDALSDSEDDIEANQGSKEGK